jgi:hypothetical protein
MEAMTPKEEAKELVDKFTVVGLQQRNEGIQCALIHVNEILDKFDPRKKHYASYYTIEHYRAVKTEIEKL